MICLKHPVYVIQKNTSWHIIKLMIPDFSLGPELFPAFFQKQSTAEVYCLLLVPAPIYIPNVPTTFHSVTGGGI